MTERTVFYYTRKLISEVKLTSTVEKDLGVDSTQFDWIEYIENGEMGRAEGHSVEIQTFIDALTKLKELGSTHVDLSWDSDRERYDVDGYFLRPALEIEVQSLGQIAKIQNERQLEIAKLRAQIKEIESRPLPKF